MEEIIYQTVEQEEQEIEYYDELIGDLEEEIE